MNSPECVVHVAHLPEIAADRGLLTVEERARAERFVVAGPADQFVRSRVLLRSVLGELLGCRPQAVELAFGRQGRPRLAGSEELDFNLSHSGPWAALAVTHHGPIGVDVEVVDDGRPLLRLGQRFFSKSEARWFEALPEADRALSFYRLWTLKEAYLKALGTGLTFSSRRFSFRLDGPGGLARLVETEWPGDEVTRWCFDETALPPGSPDGSPDPPVPPARLAVCRTVVQGQEPASVLWRFAAG